MDLDRQAELYNYCNPEEPLRPDDPRNVDIEEDYDGDVRGASWVEDAVRRIRFVGGNGTWTGMFCGLPGSGKSTELRRLETRLSGMSILPAPVDAEGIIDLNSPVDLPDILLLLLFGVERAVLVLEGARAEDAMQEGLLTRMLRWFSTTEVSLEDIEVEASAGANIPGDLANATAGGKLALKLMEKPSLRAQFRNLVSGDFERFLGDVRQELEQLVRRARSLGKRDIVVVFDSLEKLRGTTTSWKQVLDSAEVLFRRIYADIELPVHVVYTVPPPLLLRLNIPTLHFMPMIKLRDRVTGEWFRQGFEAARKIVQQRLSDDDLRYLLQANEIEGPIRELIETSGGYPRELVRLLQDVVASGPLDDREFRRLLGRTGDNVRAAISSAQTVSILATVARTQSVVVDDELKPFVDQLFANNIILRYQNDQFWYDLHPAALEYPPVQREIKRQERALELRERSADGP